MACAVRGWEPELMWIGKENQPISRALNKMDTLTEIRIIKELDNQSQNCEYLEAEIDKRVTKLYGL